MPPSDMAVYDARDAEISQLKEEIERLKAEATDVDKMATALVALRHVLRPLHKAMGMIFGELDAFEDQGERQTSSGSAAPKSAAVWEAWKAKLPPACGKVIDALLIHGGLTRAQLKVAAAMAFGTVDSAVSRLKSAGVVVAQGGRYSLKKL